MVVNLFDPKAPAAPAKQVKTPAVKTAAPVIAKPAATTKGINVQNIETQAMADRVQQTKDAPKMGGYNRYTLTKGKQLSTAVDAIDTLVKKGIPKLWQGIMNTASLVPEASSKIETGVSVLKQRLQGKTENFTKPDTARIKDQIADNVRSLGRVTKEQRTEHTVFEMEKLAEIAEMAGRDEDARNLRTAGKLTTIQNMSDQDVIDVLDKPGAARKFIRALAELAPSIAVAQGAAGQLAPTLSAGTRLGMKGALGSATKTATSELIPSTIFSMLERDPDSPIAKQLKQAGLNAAMFAGTAGAFSLAGSAAKAVTPKPIRQAVADFLTKMHTTGGNTNADDEQFLGYLREKRMAGEQIIKPKQPDMNALVAKYGSEDAIPLRELSPQGVADAVASKAILKNGGSLDDALAMRSPEPSASINVPGAARGVSRVLETTGSVADNALADLRNLSIDRGTKLPFLSRVKGGVSNFVDVLHQGLISRFAPLNKVEKALYKNADLPLPKLKLAEKFEDFAGANGKAEADVIHAQMYVGDHVKSMPREFQDYLTANRILDRLQTDTKTRFVNQEIIAKDGTKRMVSWTPEKAQMALDQLKAEIGDEAWAAMEITGKRYQEIMDKSLQLQVESGNISAAQYAEIKSKNKFYAPFKIMQQASDDLEKALGVGEGMSKSMSTTAQLTKKVKGVEGDFFIDDIWESSLQQLWRSRVLAEKNLKMQELGKLVGMEGSENFMRPLAGEAKPPRGWSTAHYRVDGQDVKMAISPEVTSAVQGMNTQLTGFLANALRMGSVPLKFGATVANVPFQVLNVAFRDPLRGYTYFRYGSKNPMTFGADMLRGFYSSVKGNFGKQSDGMFIDFLKSGAASGDVSSQITPNVIPKSLISKYGQRLNLITNTVKFSRALEQTGKMTGFLRGAKDVNSQFKVKGSMVDWAKYGKDDTYKEAMDVMFHEVRNYSGSPDFARGGTISPDINLLYMFFSARSQAAAADLGRLAGMRGKGTGKAWATVAAVSTPIMLNEIRNQLFYPEAMKQLTSWERQNYVFIPNGKKFINDAGQEVWDGYRIPKEGILGGMWSTLEQGVDFAFTKDPSNATTAALDLLQSAMPINIDGQNALESGESILAGLNPIIKSPVEYFTGRDLYRHRNVIDRNYNGVNLKDVYPEQQFTDQTPAIYKAPSQAFTGITGQHSPELLSPERIRQAVGGLTGGFTNQLATPAPLKGRSVLSDVLITKRFYRTQWVADPAMQEDAVAALKRQESGRLEDNLKAENLVLSLKEDPSSAKQRLMDLEKTDKALWKKTVDVLKDNAIGLTYADRLVKQMNVKDGTRAIFIDSQIHKMKRDEASAFLKDLGKKNLLSDEVVKQLGILASRRKK